MVNNDVMRSVRYILQLSSAKMAEICSLGGLEIPKADIHDYLRGETEPEYRPCGDEIMAHFLNGLIIFRRGLDPARPPAPLELPVSNNSVFKKLRVAFELREEDLIDLLKDSGLHFGKAEISAILRKKGHRNYRECGDQVLRNLLKGLALKYHRTGEEGGTSEPC
jgi:uncharacterized protein YehS (DUF1456 family)